MVAAGHYGAAHAAFAILEAGGNAVDAAVAGGIALGVLQPDIVNVAGVAPIMLRMADGSSRPSPVSATGPPPPIPTASRARTAATFRKTSCARSFRPRRTPGSRR